MRASGIAHAAAHAVIAGLLGGAAWQGAPAIAADVPPRGSGGAAAFAVLDIESRRTLREARGSELERPVLPGSLMKVITLAAALEQGTVGARTRLACSRRVRMAGRILDCVHPPLPGGATPAEALAHSCNAFFTAIAPRVGRDALSRQAVALGLPPLPAGATLALAGVGLDGAAVAPRALLRAFMRLVHPESSARVPHETLLEGLRAAATVGTAAALGRAGVDALAKTATVTLATGQPAGLVVAAAPARSPRRAVVVLVPGGAGRDAAGIAAGLLADVAPTASLELQPTTGAPSPIAVGRARGKGYVVERLSLEEYVAAVVTAEAPPRAAGALLEALAIAARTFASYERRRHEADGFDVCDLTHCQVVGASPSVAAAAATRATEGLVLTASGRVARVWYSANCGGWLQPPESAWPGAGARAVRSDTGRAEPASHDVEPWTSDIRAADLHEALVAAGATGDRLRGVRIASRGAGGRAQRVALEGLAPATLPAEAFRSAVGRRLGWARLKSTLFRVERTATGYRFVGRGRGHGVGLCVAGAAALARGGADARAILRTYFPALAVTETRRAAPHPGTAARTPPLVRVVLPVEDESHRTRVERTVEEAVARLEARTGVTAPAGITLRFHPTAASYGRATGLPWWTSAAAEDRRIELVPLRSIERRGALARTVRHELAHVITGEALAGAPRWVREGAAVHFAGDHRPERPGRARVSKPRVCPPDSAFLRAASANALERLYEEARRCFVDALTRGADWRTIRWTDPPPAR